VNSRSFVATVFVIAGALGGAARAEPQARDRETPPPPVIDVPPVPEAPRALWSMDVNLGVGTPKGALSVARDLPGPGWLGVRGSVGLGSGGPQVAVMPYLRVPLPRGAAARLFLGLSAGPYVWHEGPLCFADDCATKKASLAAWSNVELAIEWSRGAGWHARPYLGFGNMIDSGALHCTGNDHAVAHCMSDHAEDGSSRIYGGVAIGHAW